MKQSKIVIQQYCPVMEKNVTIEKHFDEKNNEKFECLHFHKCKSDDGGCRNKLLNVYKIDEKRPHNAQ